MSVLRGFRNELVGLEPFALQGRKQHHVVGCLGWKLATDS